MKYNITPIWRISVLQRSQTNSCRRKANDYDYCTEVITKKANNRSYLKERALIYEMFKYYNLKIRKISTEILKSEQIFKTRHFFSLVLLWSRFSH